MLTKTGLVQLLCATLILCAPSAGAAQESKSELDAKVMIASGHTSDNALRQGRASRTGTKWRVRVPKMSCVIVHAVAESRVRNLDVKMSRGKKLVAKDGSAGPHATARYCTGNKKQSLNVRVLSLSGSGIFSAVVVIKKDEVPDSSSGQTEHSAAGLVTRLQAQIKKKSVGYRVASVVKRGSVSRAKSIDSKLVVQAGRCYRVFVEADRRVDVSIRSNSGESLRAQQGSSIALGVNRPFCPPRTGELALRIKGNAMVMWQSYGSTPAPSAAKRTKQYKVGGEGNSYIARNIRDAHRADGEGYAASTPRFDVALKRSEVKTVSAAAKSATCFVVVAAGVPSVRTLSIEVVDSLGNRKGRVVAPSKASLKVCPSVEGVFSARIKVEDGYGKIGIQVFSN